LLVLRELIAQEKQQHVGPPNRHNFSLRFRSNSLPVQRAIMEAWAWLESSGCLAGNPEYSEGAFFVTRHQSSRSGRPGPAGAGL
jgi:hypothetical protein